MGKDTFEQVVKAASQADKLVLSACTLEALTELDFSGPHYR